MKSIIKVNKIRSYQTLVYKNGNRTFKKKEYTKYIQEIQKQLKDDHTFTKDIMVSIKFYSNTRAIGDLDNITKPILDILQSSGIISNDRYIIKLELSKVFGSKENIIEIDVSEYKPSGVIQI
jgi:Holliday junction resolvase RusA-like endonuclease